MRVVFLLACICLLTLSLASGVHPVFGSEPPAPGKSTFDVEWRLIHAGTVSIDLDGNQGSVNLNSAGLVSALYKVEDLYTVHYDDGFCVTSSVLDGKEGSRHRRLEVDVHARRSSFIERDLLKGVVMHQGQIEVPPCVHDVLGAIYALRAQTVAPGQSITLPMSDGRHAAMVKVEAQEREDVTTPMGTFHTIRYEPIMMNGVIYARKGRVFIWLTDDAKKMPVQIRLRLAFPVGTVTLQLEKGL